MKEKKHFPLESKNDDFLSGYLDTNTGQVPKDTNSNPVTRQTFMISVSNLDKLRNFVHTKRKYEDYNYSQRQALEDALNMLFSSLDNIEVREP